MPRPAIAVSYAAAIMRDREPQPTFVAPMLLTSGAVPDGDAWTLEVKWDGCRAQLRYDGRSVSVRTRHGRECSGEFPEFADIAGVLGKCQVTLTASWSVCVRMAGRTSPGFAADSPAQQNIGPRRCFRSSTSCT
jgi:hypothetical protein